MSGKKVRFLTSAEKMSSPGKHSREDERMEGDPNAFISVLINGNYFQVKASKTFFEYEGGAKRLSSFWTNMSARTNGEA